LAEVPEVRKGLERLGIDLDQVAEQLEKEGVRKFIEPFDKLQGWLEERRGK
jgi:transaldolase